MLQHGHRDAVAVHHRRRHLRPREVEARPERTGVGGARSAEEGRGDEDKEEDEEEDHDEEEEEEEEDGLYT